MEVLELVAREREAEEPVLAERLVALERCLAKLGRADQDLIKARSIDRISPDDIAQRLAVSRRTTFRHLERVRVDEQPHPRPSNALSTSSGSGSKNAAGTVNSPLATPAVRSRSLTRGSNRTSATGWLRLQMMSRSSPFIAARCRERCVFASCMLSRVFRIRSHETRK